jgi:hypothetical protein
MVPELLPQPGRSDGGCDSGLCTGCCSPPGTAPRLMKSLNILGSRDRRVGLPGDAGDMRPPAGDMRPPAGDMRPLMPAGDMRPAEGPGDMRPAEGPGDMRPLTPGERLRLVGLSLPLVAAVQLPSLQGRGVAATLLSPLHPSAATALWAASCSHQPCDLWHCLQAQLLQQARLMGGGDQGAWEAGGGGQPAGG